MERLANIIDTYYPKYFRHEFFRKNRNIVIYFVFGSFAALVDLGIYLVFFNIFGVGAVPSTILSISLATIVGFFLNAIVNFRVNNRYVLRFISYASVSGVGIFVSSLMLHVLHNILGFDGNIVKVISLPVIFLLQYVLNSRISFRKAHFHDNNKSGVHIN